MLFCLYFDTIRPVTPVFTPKIAEMFFCLVLLCGAFFLLCFFSFFSASY